MPTPAWSSKLPLIRGQRTVVVDNNAISDYYVRGYRNDDLHYLFEDATVRLFCGRQVIDEALNAPGLQPDTRRTLFEELGELQASGKLVLSGASQMPAVMLTTYQALAQLLATSALSAEDARIYADAIVKRIPLYTSERRNKLAIANAVRNRAVAAFLSGNGLPATPEAILANYP
jgi:hypothetical protein